MKTIDVLSIVLVVLGALNWGLVGLFQFNAVSAVLGDATALTRLVYVVVGAAGVFHALQWQAMQKRWMDPGRTATA